MSERVKSVLDQALQLSDHDRGEVAAGLLASLHADTEEGVDQAWAEEIRQRLVDRGAPIPWADARRRTLESGDEDYIRKPGHHSRETP